MIILTSVEWVLGVERVRGNAGRDTAVAAIVQVGPLAAAVSWTQQSCEVNPFQLKKLPLGTFLNQVPPNCRLGGLLCKGLTHCLSKAPRGQIWLHSLLWPVKRKSHLSRGFEDHCVAPSCSLPLGQGISVSQFKVFLQPGSQNGADVEQSPS